MTAEDIRAADYAYPSDQQALADAERGLLGDQLRRLVRTDRFGLDRVAERRRLRDDRFDIHILDADGPIGYVRDQRVVHESAAAWFDIESDDSVQDAFYRHTATEPRETAPNHLMSLASSVAKGDSSPEPTRRHVVLDEALMETAKGKRAARVAIIDTGLAEEIRADGWLDAVPRSQANRDVLDRADDTDTLLDLGAGHGTFVAGIVQQVCPTADIRVYRALDTDGVGAEDVLAQTLIQAAEDGSEIINLSLGTSTIDGQPPLALRLGIQRLAVEYPDVLVVASAGNDGTQVETWPAAFKNVRAVAALTAGLEPAEWSSNGDWVNCSTVGEGIVSTFVDGTEATAGGSSVFGADAWAMWSGTSFTAPQIAGAVARLLQAHRDDDWTPGQAYEALVAGTPTEPGYGRVVHLLPGTPRPEGWTFPTDDGPAVVTSA